MINPISTGPQAPSSAMPLHEAVLRYGGTQEVRDQARRQTASDDVQDHVDLPCDASFVSEAGPEGGEASESASASSSQASGGESRVQHHGGHRETGGPGLQEGKPGQDGVEQQQEQALAQHAAEQQGKRELGHQDVDRSHRSTRAMMGRVENVKGGNGRAQGAEASHDSKPEGASHSGHASGPAARRTGGDGGSHAISHGEGHGPGAHASAKGSESASGFAPRVGGDVIAAAVSSGITSTSALEPGSAQSDDEVDDEAQQVDGSEEATDHQHSEQGPRGAKSTAMEPHLEFGGEGSRDRKSDRPSREGSQDADHHQKEQEPGTQAQSDKEREEQSPQASQSGSEPAAPATAEVVPLSPPDAPETSTMTVPAEAPPQDRVASVDAAPAEASADATPDVVGEPELHVGDANQPPATDDGPQPRAADRMERAVVTAPGLSLLGNEEYFFFDDARITGIDAAAS